jgi:hypothetical protein
MPKPIGKDNIYRVKLLVDTAFLADKTDSSITKLFNFVCEMRGVPNM